MSTRSPAVSIRPCITLDRLPVAGELERRVVDLRQVGAERRRAETFPDVGPRGGRHSSGVTRSVEHELERAAERVGIGGRAEHGRCCRR